MSSANKKEFLYLIWKAPETRRNFTVGILTRENHFTFQYCKEEYKLAKEQGWRELEAFPEDKIYESDVLFPVFSSRLPDPKRRDIQNILEKYGLKKYDAFELLAKNGGRLPIDTYEFISPIFPNDEKIEREFFIMGIRYSFSCSGKDCSDLPNIVSVGDLLTLVPEPENENDPFAIRITTNDGVHLGYIPRYYNQAVLARISKGLTYSCQVVERNLSNICSECVKVRLAIPSLVSPDGTSEA